MSSFYKKAAITLLGAVFALTAAFSAFGQSDDSSVLNQCLSLEPSGFDSYGVYDGSCLEIWGSPGDIIPINLKITNNYDFECSFSVVPLDESLEEGGAFSGIAQGPAGVWRLKPGESVDITANITVYPDMYDAPAQGYFVLFRHEEAAEDLLSVDEESSAESNEKPQPLEADRLEEDKGEETEDNAGAAEEESTEEAANENEELNLQEVDGGAEEPAPAEAPAGDAVQEEQLSGAGGINDNALRYPSKKISPTLTRLSADSTAGGQISEPVNRLEVRVNSITPYAIAGMSLTVPSFSFGAGNMIKSTLASYTTPTISGALTIVDARVLSGGWRLTAQMGSFSNPTYPGALSGATLNLPAPTVSLGGVVVQSVGAYSARLTAGEGSAHTIMSAGMGVSLGTWTASFNPTGISLNVIPGTAYSGTSSSTILWTLYDAP